MQKAYARINWQNSPSTATPLGESKLLPMDASIDEIDNRVVTFDTTKANQSDLLGCLSNVTYNGSTGVFVFTWKNGNTLTADLNIEKIPVNFSMSAAGVITMTTSDGSTYTADVGDLIKTYTFQDSSEIDFTTTTDASGNKTVTASLVDGSISGSKLYPNYLADCQAAVSNSSANATLAQSWAVGGTNTRTGEDTNNAEYWCRMAEQASGDGHTIIDPEGTAMTNETGLQFTGSVEVTDDPTNMRTVVNMTGVADNPTFTEASTRANITSGESFSTILGKIKKFFTDLKTVAFSGSYSDLSGTENVAYKNINNQFSANQTIDTANGTTSSLGYSGLVVGNSTPEGTAGNSVGRISIYGKDAAFGRIEARNVTETRTIQFPDASGTIALTPTTVTTITKLTPTVPNGGATTKVAEFTLDAGKWLIWLNGYSPVEGTQNNIGQATQINVVNVGRISLSYLFNFFGFKEISARTTFDVNVTNWESAATSAAGTNYTLTAIKIG